MTTRRAIPRNRLPTISTGVLQHPVESIPTTWKCERLQGDKPLSTSSALQQEAIAKESPTNRQTWQVSLNQLSMEEFAPSTVGGPRMTPRLMKCSGACVPPRDVACLVVCLFWVPGRRRCKDPRRSKRSLAIRWMRWRYSWSPSVGATCKCEKTKLQNPETLVKTYFWKSWDLGIDWWNLWMFGEVLPKQHI